MNPISLVDFLSFSLTMPYPSGQQLVMVMSDDQGFGSGGVSPVILVGEPVHHILCDLHIDCASLISALCSLLN